MKHYRFSILVTIAIIVLSTINIPENAPLSDVQFIDKWTHLVMYAGLSVAMWIDRRGLVRRLQASYYGMMFLLPTLLGIMLEFVQECFTTYRSGEVLDGVADGVGALLGTLVCLLISTIWQKKTLHRK